MGNAGGIFLWVTLTTDSLLVKYDQGKSLEFLLQHIDAMPSELENLFAEMVTSISPELRMVALRAFQWALMSTTPLRLHQWHHVLAFIKTPVPKSLQEWRTSVNYTESDSQLEREIKALSGGLLQVSAARSSDALEEEDDRLSICAGAGSLDLEQGESRIVQVIHQSVRDFFLEGGGFRFLDNSVTPNPIGCCHITIAMTCLDYICISELDALVSARRRVRDQEAISLPKPEPSENRGDRISADGSDVPAYPWHMQSWSGDAEGGQKEALAEALSMIPMADHSTDIANWIAAGNILTDPASPPASIRIATSLFSAANVSHRLEDWTSLLLYVTSSLATHLRAIRTEGGIEVAAFGFNDEALSRRLNDEDLLARFVLLKEDPHSDTTFSNWISNQGSIRNGHSGPYTEFFRNNGWDLPSPRGSVASFASASSYGANRSQQSERSLRQHPTTLPWETRHSRGLSVIGGSENEVEDSQHGSVSCNAEEVSASSRTKHRLTHQKQDLNVRPLIWEDSPDSFP